LHIFPAIATRGKSYITENKELYPFANAVGRKAKNVRIIPRPAGFVKARDIAKNNWTALEVIALREEARIRNLYETIDDC
jgi:hypothetical protein